MYSSDQSRQFLGELPHTSDGHMDDAGYYLSDQRQTALWRLPEFMNNSTSSHSTRPPPSSSATQALDFSFQPTQTADQRQLPDRVAPHVEDEYTLLLIENAKLREALAQTTQDLETARRATCDLAAWAVQDRSRLLTEALHQRLRREEYEAFLRQRDEQVVYLLALHQEAKLGHARTLVQEGEAMDQPVLMESLQRINEMRAQLGFPEIDRVGAVQEAARTDLYMQEDTEGDERALSQLWTDALQVLEKGEVPERDEDAYSPPEVERSSSINAQVDELIAEEAGRLGGW